MIVRRNWINEEELVGVRIHGLARVTAREAKSSAEEGMVLTRHDVMSGSLTGGPIEERND
jgi:hypothetical protein